MKTLRPVQQTLLSLAILLCVPFCCYAQNASASELQKNEKYIKGFREKYLTTVEINGGDFHKPLTATKFAPRAKKIKLTINGGTFYGGLYGIAGSATKPYYGNIEITINGGKFYGKIAAAQKPDAIYKGTYTLKLNGGDFASVADVVGTTSLKGRAKSAIKVGGSLDINAKESGTIEFNNPLCEGADPWMFFHDGYYYFTITGGERLKGWKLANISDLRYAQPAIIWQPQPDREYSRNLWSPEIHYLSEKDAGAENAGWYLYLACDDGDNANHRMYVLRSLSGDPLGPYGSATSGELNVPTKITGCDDPSINNEWSVGVTFLRHKGKLYIMWVGRFGGKHEAEHWQCIYLAELKNPWTIKGEKHIICRPTLKWETYGAGVYSGRRFPKVVEGGTPVYDDSGELAFIVYSGSGYWTSRYALGQMKLIGDNPLDEKSWQKSKQPIFAKSKTTNGCGHASFTTSPDGKTRWAIYHAYIGRKSRTNHRKVFAETYTVDPSGVTISNGSRQPLPLETVLKLDVNPMPLGKKISAFDKMNFRATN